MEWKILDDKRKSILQNLVKSIELKDYYMAGGTALSLQLGLRKSIDFDFFVPHSFDTDNLLREITKLYPDTKIRQHTERTLDLDVEGIQVSFFHYGYEMVNPYVFDKNLPELKMASPQDIAAMKLSAIGSRGSRKDFYDLYQICNKMDISPESMNRILQIKFGKNTDPSYMIMGLSYFADAENEKLSELYVDYDWKRVKSFFEHYALEMRNDLYKQESTDKSVEKKINDSKKK